MTRTSRAKPWGVGEREESDDGVAERRARAAGDGGVWLRRCERAVGTRGGGRGDAREHEPAFSSQTTTSTLTPTSSFLSLSSSYVSHPRGQLFPASQRLPRNPPFFVPGLLSSPHEPALTLAPRHRIHQPSGIADDDLAPSQTSGYRVGQEKTLAELAALDQEDESLARWKASLGLSAAGDTSAAKKVGLCLR
jgi:hypothetical protein